MISKVLNGMREALNLRRIMVGSVMGNNNTVGGGGVYPIVNLKQLDISKKSFDNHIAMADGYSFISTKAYNDSKLSLVMASNFLHSNFHKSKGVIFSSIYSSSITETPLFREKRVWFASTSISS